MIKSTFTNLLYYLKNVSLVWKPINTIMIKYTDVPAIYFNCTVQNRARQKKSYNFWFFNIGVGNRLYLHLYNISDYR